MGTVIVTVTSAVIGAVVGALITKWMTPDYSGLQRQLVDAQERIASLEEERSEWERTQRFIPKVTIGGEVPDDQWIELKANQTFSIARMDYLADGDAMVASQEVGAEGGEIKIPIDHAKLVKIHNLSPRPGNSAIPIKFRCHLVVNGRAKVHSVEALITPTWKNINGTTTYCQQVVGGL